MAKPKTAIKYQQQIHEGFAEKLDDKAKTEFQQIIEAYPEMAERLEFKPSDDAEAIAEGNLEICEHFFLKQDVGDDVEFSTPHSKTVTQTVRANVTAYKAVSTALEQEQVEEYAKIYASLKKTYEEYFSLVAEDFLEAVYGEQYTQYRDTKTAELKKMYGERVAERNKSE